MGLEFRVGFEFGIWVGYDVMGLSLGLGSGVRVRFEVGFAGGEFWVWFGIEVVVNINYCESLLIGPEISLFFNFRFFSIFVDVNSKYHQKPNHSNQRLSHIWPTKIFECNHSASITSPTARV